MFEITPDKLLKLEYENETLKNDSILSDYERIQFIENGIGLSVTFIEHTYNKKLITTVKCKM